jgi:hypothetical protein
MTEPEITPPPAKPKRPSEFSDEIFDTICDRMTGGEWLRKICDKDPEMPSRQSFLRWIEKDTGRQAKYAAASRAMVDYWAEELLELSQETEKDTIVEKDGRRKCNFEWVANKRLHSENLRFLMSKIYSKKYGDKPLESEQEPTHIQVSWVTRTIVDPLMNPGDGELTIEQQLRRRIITLEQQLGMREKPAEPPRLLTYDPGPLPVRIEPEVLTRFLRMIKGTVPKADQRSPEEVLEEVIAVCGKALEAEYGTTENAA